MRNFFLIVILITSIATSAVASARAGSATANSSSYSVAGVVHAYETGKMRSPQYTLQAGFSYTLTKSVLSPIITSLDPREGNNLAPLKSIKISGANFSTGATVKLQATGFSTITATNVKVISQNEISCDLDLTGVVAGVRDVVVVSPDGSEGVLPGAFRVNSYAYTTDLVVCSPNPFDPAREPATFIYKLENDTNVNIYIFSTSADLVWKTSYNTGENGGKQGENAITWNGISNFGERASNGLYFVHVVDRGTGATRARGKLAVLFR